MNDKNLQEKIAKVPLANPGFDAFGMTAPVLVQMNPNGKWENNKPDNLDEECLKTIVQHLVNTKAVAAAQSYCCQCAMENQKNGASNSSYVPVIMMPVNSAEQCPFDMECEVEKMKDMESKKPSKSEKSITEKERETQKDKKVKKRSFTIQRLTDFDLLSQW